MWENSTSNVVGEFCGTSKVVSSAYLRITLTGEIGTNSAVYIVCGWLGSVVVRASACEQHRDL